MSITTEQVLASADMERWKVFCEKWEKQNTGYEKYFDLKRNIGRILAEKDLMRLVENKKPMRILDISAGFCHWPLVCRSLGHTVLITDVKFPVVNEAQAALGFSESFYYLNYKRLANYHFCHLPWGLGRQDLISAFSSSPMSHWSRMDFSMFIDDCFDNLHPGGGLLISPNVSAGSECLFNLAEEKKIAVEFNQKKGRILLWKPE